MNDFKKALQFTLKWEGFISNDPKDDTAGDIINELAKDPGGLTIWGISYRSHPKAVMEMYRLIQEGKKDEAFEICKKIYIEVYWLKAGCNELPYPTNLIVFDGSVNMGIKKTKKLLDKAHSWEDYLLLRLYTYSKFKQAKLYFRGWANRVLDLYKLIKDDENVC
jgi:lysozyme family protein